MNENTLCCPGTTPAEHAIGSMRGRCLTATLDDYLSAYGAIGGSRGRRCNRNLGQEMCQGLSPYCKIVREWEVYLSDLRK